MASEQERLVRWFYRQNWAAGEIRFEDQLLQGCTQALAKTAEQAERYVFANKRRIWNALQKQKELDVERGRRPMFHITDRNGLKAVWAPRRSNKTNVASVLRSDALWSARPKILRKIDMISDRHYEALGCLVSELAGADKILLTPPGNEGGIDFICRISVPARTHIFGGTGAPIRIVGQCKKYKSRVGVEKIRDFAKTIDDVRHRAYHLENVVPHWFRGEKGPVIGWMIGHSGFQSGSVTIANNQGIFLNQ